MQNDLLGVWSIFYFFFIFFFFIPTTPPIKSASATEFLNVRCRLAKALRDTGVINPCPWFQYESITGGVPPTTT